MNPYSSAPGYWQRCHNVLCAPSYPGHIIATGFAQRERSTFMEILPSDTAVYLYNVTLTVAGYTGRGTAPKRQVSRLSLRGNDPATQHGVGRRERDVVTVLVTAAKTTHFVFNCAPNHVSAQHNPPAHRALPRNTATRSCPQRQTNQPDW